jgi:rhodanese-related sulfurtransferase
MVRAGDTVIDVRRPEEFARGHIAGAINVPIETLPAGVDGIEGQLLTACSMGGRASRAADLLVAAGRCSRPPRPRGCAETALSVLSPRVET